VPVEYYIGIMSGTSLDGVDICIVKKSSSSFLLEHFTCLPYSKTLKLELIVFNSVEHVNLASLAKLQHELAKVYSQAVTKILTIAKMQAKQITAIGCHGQTVFHDDTIPMSIQLGHPAFIAKKTGIQTVADFRIDDMANGGLGAPISPAFHQFIFKKSKAIAVVNIGGIANISILSAQETIGFDIGPGNCLMDELCQRHLQKDYDMNGEIAKNTPINKDLLDKLLSHDYFQQLAPKSTGRDIFNLSWLQKNLSGSETIAEQISTLNQLTARTISDTIKRYPQIEEIIICGGGAENTTLLSRIEQATNIAVNNSLKYNINPHSLEALMMAWLAEQRLAKKTIKLSKITGAKKDSILGGVWEA